MWFIVVCTLIDNKQAPLLFSQTSFFFVLSLHVERVCKRVWKESFWSEEVAHLHNAAGRAFKSEPVFSIVNKFWQRFLSLSLVLWKKIRLWLSVVCTLIENDMRHHSGQNLLWTTHEKPGTMTPAPFWRPRTVCIFCPAEARVKSRRRLALA